MAINVKDAEEKLGKDKIKEIAEKDWKVATPPTEEELVKEEPKNPKARNNPNSCKNLAQYNKKTPEQKEKSLKNLQFVEKEEDLNLEEFLGPEIFKALPTIPLTAALDFLANRKEQDYYYSFVKLTLQDFDISDLTYSDIDDVLTLAANHVHIHRLMKGSSKNPMLTLEAAPTIERYKKDSAKIKASLSSRRVDRIDTKNRPAFSIVDLGVELDARQDADYERRIKEMEEKVLTYVPPKRNEEGYVVDDDE